MFIYKFILNLIKENLLDKGIKVNLFLIIHIEMRVPMDLNNSGRVTLLLNEKINFKSI